MNIRFNKRQRRQIKNLIACYHGRERVNLYEIFKAIAYLVYTGCQWKMLPTYFPRPTTVVECVKSNFGTQEFIPLSGRWVVERTNAWLENFRRLCRNYERYLTTARAMAYLASILFMLRYE